MTGPAWEWLDDLAPGAFDAATETLRAVMRDRGTVVLAAHVAPDGDSLGATLALHAALTAAGVDSRPTVGEEPLRLSGPLAELPHADELVAPSLLPPVRELALLVALDAASPERLGTVAELVEAGVPTLVIDHHERNTPFGDVRLVAPRAAATVVVVEELLRRLGVALTSDIATCLYVGLVTDTGRFGHASTDRTTMELAGRLLDTGIDQAALTQRLFGDRSLGELRLLGQALARLDFEPEVALVHTFLTETDLSSVDAGTEAGEEVVDIVRTADVAEVALVCRPGRDGCWRASLRSTGAIDVGAIAAGLGGGGHARASGFTSDHADVADVVADVVAAVRAAVPEGG